MEKHRVRNGICYVYSLQVEETYIGRCEKHPLTCFKCEKEILGYAHRQKVRGAGNLIRHLCKQCHEELKKNTKDGIPLSLGSSLRREDSLRRPPRLDIKEEAREEPAH